MKLVQHLIILIVFLSTMPSLASDKLCPEGNTLLSALGVKASEPQITFFVGLYSKADIQDRADLSMATGHNDPRQMARDIEPVHRRLAQRLYSDKLTLKTWINTNSLDSEIIVLDQPENNYFILFKTSALTAAHITCAAASGTLPEVFAQVGY